MYNHLIAVTKRSLCPDGLPAQLERVCAVSPRAVLLREKDLSSAEYRALAQQAQEICTRFDVPLILHSFPQVAQELGISRLHVPLPMLRMLEQREQWEVLGTSCHSMEQMQEAVSLGATYITLGNIFATTCKPGLPGKGVDMLRAVCAHSPIPVYAIGGITLDNLSDTLEAGAAGGCMMSGFMRL